MGNKTLKNASYPNDARKLGLNAQVVIANATAEAGNVYLVDTSAGAVELTLPVSPLVGDTVQLLDVVGNFGTNNCTVKRGDTNHTIMGNSDDMLVDIDNSSLDLFFYNGDWRIK
jgi:hypothetical protein